MSAQLSPEWSRNPPRMDLPRRAGTYQFRSTPDGDEVLCRSCQRAGYGIDAWHPATVEFWPTWNDRLIFNKCKACRSEVTARKFGFVPAERVAA